MAENDLDYHIDEDLEQIFHSDLQNLELGVSLGHNESSHDDVVADHLPEWLVGVIVVIIMLIVAFFVMIITSLIKNRQKNRASTYIGTNGTAGGCDDLESGKIGNGEAVNMKMTSFTSVPDGFRESHVDSNTKSDDKERLTNGQANTDNGVQGCRNPLFVDDEQDVAGSENRKEVAGDAHRPAASGQSAASTSSSGRDKDTAESEKPKNTANKQKQSSVSQKTNLVPGTEDEQLSEDEAEISEKPSATKLKSGTSTLCKRDRKESVSVGGGNLAAVRGSGENTQEEGGGGDEKDLRSEVAADFRECGFESCCEDSGVELSSVECKTASRRGSLLDGKGVLPSSGRDPENDAISGLDKQLTSHSTTADVIAPGTALHQNQINIFIEGASVLDSSFGDLSPTPTADDCQLDGGRCGEDLAEDVLNCSSAPLSSGPAMCVVQPVSSDHHQTDVSCSNSPAVHRDSYSCPSFSTTQLLANQDEDDFTDLGVAMSTNL
ncbi:unnamed protein product [Lymnaea stagnalis]|uniref:Uncharacterized protein n=1 Tax=Lymnaea stagnalis TaxID=6523 RepID=A0AAV2HA87_LYMST